MSRLRGGALAILALIVIVPVVLLASRGTPAPAPPGEPARSVLPSPSSVAGGPLDLDSIEWVYAPPPVVTGGPDGAYLLQAGTLGDDEPIVDLEIPWRAELGPGIAREPAIGAPHGGSVVYVADDGAASEIRRVEIAANGRDELLATLDHVIWDIAVAPDESAAYAAVVDRADTTRDLGVMRILLDGSGSVEPVMPPAPLGTSTDVRRTAVLSFQVNLAISSDGKYLIRRTCHEADGCVVQVAELANGRAVELPDREVLGVAAGVIVARRCDLDGCRLEATDIETRATLSADLDVFGPVREVDEGPVVVPIVSDANGLITVEAVDPASGRRRVLYRAPEGANLSYSDFLSVQMDVPEEFVYVIEMTPVGNDGAVIRVDERHLLISVVDGRAIVVPRPSYRQPPGFGTQG